MLRPWAPHRLTQRALQLQILHAAKCAAFRMTILVGLSPIANLSRTAHRRGIWLGSLLNVACLAVIHTQSRSLELRPAPLKTRGKTETRGTSLGMTVGWKVARGSVTRTVTRMERRANARR